MAIATPRWSDLRFQPGKSASMSWDVIGAADAAAAIAADGVLREGATHPLDASLVAEAPTASRPAFGMWTVSTNFAAPSTTPAQLEPNPLKRPPKVRWQVGSSSEAFNRDADGRSIRNTVGDIYQGGFYRNVTTIFAAVTVVLASFDVRAAFRFGNTTNSGKFNFGGYDIEADQALCNSITPGGEIDRDTKYVPVTASFEFRADRFFLRAPSQGRNAYWRYVDPSSGKEYTGVGKIDAGVGTAVSEDVLLNADGVPVNPNYKTADTGKTITRPPRQPTNYQIEQPPSDDGTVFLLWRQYPTSDFGELMRYLRMTR